MVIVASLLLLGTCSAFVIHNGLASQSLSQRSRRSTFLQSQRYTESPPMSGNHQLSDNVRLASNTSPFSSFPTPKIVTSTSTTKSSSSSSTTTTTKPLHLFDNVDLSEYYEKYTPPTSRKRQTWHDRFLEVKAFFHANETYFPRSTPLGRWIHQQRLDYAADKLDRDKVALLESIGLDWEIPVLRRKRPSWEQMYAQLLTYREEHGHCRVPHSRGYLGVWVKQQRHYFKKRTAAAAATADNKNEYNPLTQERIDLLNLVGFTWSVLVRKPRTWNDSYKELVEFFIEHGHTQVATKHGDRRLMDWVRQQRHYFQEYQRNPHARSNVLTFDKISLLKKIGFSFEDPHYVGWKEAFRELSHYFALHGHTNVLPEDSWHLHLWVQQQRILFMEWMKASSSSDSPPPTAATTTTTTRPFLSNVDEERIQLLLGVNFCFDPVEANFWVQYEKLRNMESPDPRRWSIRVRQWVQQQKAYYGTHAEWWIFNNTIHTGHLTEDELRSFRWPKKQFEYDQRLEQLESRLSHELSMLQQSTVELTNYLFENNNDYNDNDDSQEELSTTTTTTPTKLPPSIRLVSANETMIKEELRSHFYKRLYREYRKHNSRHTSHDPHHHHDNNNIDDNKEGSALELPQDPLTPSRMVSMRKILKTLGSIHRERSRLLYTLREHNLSVTTTQPQETLLLHQLLAETTTTKTTTRGEEEQDRDKAWDDETRPLRSFLATHGHLRIRLDHPELGGLCNLLRQRYSRYNVVSAKTLAPTQLPSPRIQRRIQQLNEWGFVWDRHDQRWHDRYQDLVQHYWSRTQQTIDTSRLLQQDPSLHRWWSVQKQNYNRYLQNRYTIPALRVQALEAIGIQNNRGAAMIHSLATGTDRGDDDTQPIRP